jgi:hypothetical protein
MHAGVGGELEASISIGIGILALERGGDLLDFGLRRFDRRGGRKASVAG